MTTEVKLPELGENVEGGDVLRVLVSPGDRLAADQPLIELENEKATVEVPTTVQGTVREVLVKAGDKVRVGQVIVVVDEGDAGPPGPSDRTTGVERAGMSAAASSDRAGAPELPQPAAERHGRPTEPRSDTLVPAAPSARRLARELGVDIKDVRGAGLGGRISTDDVAAHAGRLLAGAGGRSGDSALPDLAVWGPVERKPFSAVRRATARLVSRAWTAPHVTQYDAADISTIEALRMSLARDAGAGGTVPTITAFAVKAVASALDTFPQFNASIDMTAEEIVYKKYLSIGIAVDTDRGLLVPVIRDVRGKSVIQIAQELAVLADRARSHKLKAEEMQGGSFSITNLGGLGGGHFSPVLNWPEVAILGIARASMQPIYADGRFEPRPMLPLSLSYDHRAIDGADGVRFLRRVVEGLELPALLELRK